MRRLHFSFLVFGIFLTQGIFAQGNNVNDPGADLVPPSPEAAAFGEYGDIPVSEFSGIPSTSIPIYNISYKGISVPVSLNYHSNGVRINEEASNVGLGWSLNAGGMISRTIRGYDDFGERQLNTNCEADNEYGYIYYDGYYYVRTQGLPAPIEPPIGPSGLYDGGNVFIGGCNNPVNLLSGDCPFGNGNFPQEFFCQDEDNATDTESDLYSFNFLGYSGKFIINDDGDFQLLDGQNIKIEATVNSPDNVKWIITTSDGTKFYFGFGQNTIQYTHSFTKSVNFSDGIAALNNCYYAQSNGQFDSDKYISSWFLKNIETVNGQTINFTYESNNEYIYPIPLYSQGKKNLFDVDASYVGPSFIPSIPFNNQENQNVTVTKYNRIYLTQVSSPFAVVQFDISNDRDDLIGGGKVDNIKIFQGGELWKRYQLNYDYFASSAYPYTNRWDLDFYETTMLNGNAVISFLISDIPDYTFTSDLINKRLKLVSVQDMGNSANATSSDIPAYELIYNEDLFFPPKTSYAMDHWGFANGAIQNNTLIPQLMTLYLNEGTGEETLVDLDGANRNPNPDLADAWLLKKISYPTGGHSTMSYEINSYKVDEEDVRVYSSDQLTLGIPIPTGGGSSTNCENIPPPNPTSIFSVENGLDNSNEILVNAKLRLGFKECASTNCSNAQSEDCLSLQNTYDLSGFKFRIINISGQLVYEWNWSEVLGGVVGNSNNVITAENTVNTYIPEGDYQLEIVPFGTSDGNLPFNIFDISFQVCWSYIQHINQRQGGGARVSQVVHYTDENTAALSESFSYLDDDGVTSGVIYNFPWYHSITTQQTSHVVQTYPSLVTYDYVYHYADRSSSSILGLSSSFLGNMVGYNKVTSSKSGIGKTEKYFFQEENQNNIPLLLLKNGVNRVINTNTGSLLEQNDYDIDDNLVRSINNEYQSITGTGNLPAHWNHKVIFNPTSISSTGGVTIGGITYNYDPMCIHTGIPLIVTYADVPQWHYLEQSTERIYCTSGSGHTDKVTNYVYDEDYYHLKESYFTNSDGNEYRTKYFYPTDDLGAYGGSAIETMKTKCMTDIPIRIESHVGGAIVGGTWTEFKVFPNQHILPWKLHSHEGDWYERAEYISYTNFDNPTEIKKRGWESEHYSWTNNLLDDKDFINWNWHWDWYSNRQLESFKDIDGQKISYTYDPYQRLKTTSARGGQVNTIHDYFYNSDENLVRSRVNFSDAPSRTTEQFFDGLGRFVLQDGIEYGPNKEKVFLDIAAYDGRNRVTAKIYMPGTSSSVSYEANPLDRIERATNPDGNYIEYEYCTNGAGEVTGYDAGTLFKTIVYDENSNPTTSFTDLAGRTIQVVDAIGGITRYEYELDNDLSSVTSPAGTFSYTYDDHHRVTSKTIPGGGTTTFTEYDERDLLISSTDANGNTTNNVYNLYGQLETSTSPTGTAEYTYEYTRIKTQDASVPGNAEGTSAAYTYDPFGRVTEQIMTTPYGESEDIYKFKYDAADNVLKSARAHNSFSGFSIKDKFEYDHQGRLLKNWQSIDDGIPNLISKNSYTTRDELAAKRLHSKNGGNTFLQYTNYAYNVMGWLETINGTNTPELKSIPADACDLPFGPPLPPTTEEVPVCDIFDLFAGGNEVTIEGFEICEPTPGGDEPPTPTKRLCDYEISIPALDEIQLISIRTSGGNINFNPPVSANQSGVSSIEQRIDNLLNSGNYNFESYSVVYEEHSETKKNLIITILQTNLVFEGVTYQSCDPKDPKNCTESTKDFSVTNCSENNTPLCSYSVLYNLPERLYSITSTDGDELINFLNYPAGSVNPNTIRNRIKQALTSRGYAFDEINIEIVEGGILIEITNTNYVFGFAIARGEGGSVPFTANCGGDTTHDDCIDIQPPPHCEDADLSAQAESIDEILTALEDFECPKEVTQITLIQVQFCDGTTLWMIDYMEALIDGPYNVINTTTVNTDDTITVIIPNENDLFSMDLNYYDPHHDLQATGYKNGNVSWLKWQVGTRVVQGYGFQYDQLDRLKNAYYNDFYTWDPGGNELAIGHIQPDMYSVFNLNYDGAGNIQTLSRNGMINCQKGVIDELIYTYGDPPGNGGPTFPSGTYSPMQLSQVTDNANAAHGFKSNFSGYQYDNNGNLLTDSGKGINQDIVYNSLNLPTEISIQNDESGTIDIEYDALGQKLKKTITNNNGDSYFLTYVNGVEYRDGVIEGIYTAEGRIVTEIIDELTPIQFRYEYTLTDHLGNARVVFSDLDDNGEITLADSENTPNIEEPTEILQENHYYPFGMNMEGSWMPQTGPKNQYQFNGKELNEDLGLDWNDYGARWYDAAIGRMTTIDPLAEEMAAYTPYHYTYNNPIKYLDLFGLAPYSYNWGAGRYEDEDGNEVGWSTVNSYIENNSGPKSFYIVSNDRTNDDGSTDWALEGVFLQAQASFIGILQVSNSKDAYNQLKEYSDNGGTIGNLIFDSHGTYNKASFKIGNQKINSRNYRSGPVYLKSIGGLLSSNSEVCLLACHVGSPKNGGTALLSLLAQRMGTTVYGSQSWTGAKPGMFSGLVTPSVGPTFISNSDSRPNALKLLGKWSKATSDGGVSTLNGSLYIGINGGFSVGTNPYAPLPMLRKIPMPGHGWH